MGDASECTGFAGLRMSGEVNALPRGACGVNTEGDATLLADERGGGGSGFSTDGLDSAGVIGGGRAAKDLEGVVEAGNS